MSSLLAIQGVLFGARFSIHDELSLGRSPDATVMLPDLQASRLHATLRREGDGYVVIDTTSRNGTFVNGERVRGQRRLAPGDEIQIGSSRFLFDARERCLASRYGMSWVIVGGREEESGTRIDLRMPPGAGGRAPEQAGSAGEGEELLTATVDEEGLSRSLLPWLMDRVGAVRGALFAHHPHESPVPLVVMPPAPALSVSAALLERAMLGEPLLYTGEVELTRFTQGHRTLERRVLSILAIPWRLAGETGGLAWLERDGDREGFSPGVLDRMASLLQKAGPALENARRIRVARRRQRAEQARDDGDRIPGELYLELAGLFERAHDLARFPGPVAVIGPRGVGKDRVARLLHAHSPRWEGPLVRLNCATLTEAQLQLELFGAERGGVPGLNHPHPGRLELADGGTLMLEQVDALGFSVQEALLRALSLREVVRRSGDQPIPIDVRILSTSSHPLERWVAEGRLRPELVPYLGQERLTVPGFDEMQRHLVPLALAMIGWMNLRLARGIRGLSAWAERALREREWSLNLWELEDLIIRAMAVAEGEVLTREDLELAELMPIRATAEPGAAGPRLSDTLREAERRLVIQALRLAKGHRGEAADLMGIPRELLEQKILALGIDLQALRLR